MNITRDVIEDLWPLYADELVSPDTRALVEEFLSNNPAFAKDMQSAASAQPIPAAPAQVEQEVKVLNRIKLRVRLVRWTLFFAMFFTMQAFGRIVQDTTWTASPKNFIATAIVAGVFWIGFIIAALRARAVGTTI